MRLGPTPHLAAALCALAALGPSLARAEHPVAVSVVRSADWSPESGREGAGEFLVLLEGAKLQKVSTRAGLIVLGDQNGMLRGGGERALRRLALSGVVIVRVASSGTAAATPEMLFIEAGRMNETTAAAALRRTMDAQGEPPRAADPDHPTSDELTAVQMYLKRVQVLFDNRNAVALATAPSPTVR